MTENKWKFKVQVDGLSEVNGGGWSAGLGKGGEINVSPQTECGTPEPYFAQWRNEIIEHSKAFAEPINGYIILPVVPDADGNKPALCFSHDLEEVQTYWDAMSEEEKITHAFYVLENMWVKSITHGEVESADTKFVDMKFDQMTLHKENQ